MKNFIKLFIFSVLFFLIFPFSSWANNFRIAAWNVETIGEDPEFYALHTILNRINADIYCFEEVKGDEDITRLQALKNILLSNYGLNYQYSCYADTSGTMNGFHIRTACISKFPIIECFSWSAAELSGDAAANDITRDIQEVHINLRNTMLALFLVHLKSSSAIASRFRRAIEIIRLRHAVNNFKAFHPGIPYIILGDFNEDITRDAPFGDVFTSVPTDVPATYHLGNDITFPVIYDPFNDLTALGMTFAEPRQEDTDDPDTYVNIQYLAYKRLDYVFSSNIGLLRTNSLIFDACDDNGIDDPPPGTFMDFNPNSSQLIVTCNQAQQTSISTTAADHFPVIVDFTVSFQQTPSLSSIAFILLILLFSLIIPKRKKFHHFHIHKNDSGQVK